MLTVYRFTADWCGPCKVLAPTLEKIANEYKDQTVEIRTVNVDENQELTQKYGVRSIPTLVFEKAGQEVDRTVGNQKYEDIVSRIKQYS